MYGLALGIERLVLRPLVNQPDIILFMATFGVTYFLIGFGELLFGGNPKSMITKELLSAGRRDRLAHPRRQGPIAEARHRRGCDRADHGLGPRAVLPEDTDRARAAGGRRRSSGGASVGVSLDQIWVIVWFTAGIVALATGIFWGARSDVSFALQVVALKALPVLIFGGLTSVPGAIVGGLIIGVGEKLGEFYWGRCSAAGSRAGLLTSSRWRSSWSARRACSGEESLSGFEATLAIGSEAEQSSAGCRG